MILIKLAVWLLACMLSGGFGESIGAGCPPVAKVLLVLIMLMTIMSVLTGWIWLPAVMVASIVVLFFAFGLARGATT